MIRSRTRVVKRHPEGDWRSVDNADIGNPLLRSGVQLDRRLILVMGAILADAGKAH
jgi:hypothetical protein